MRLKKSIKRGIAAVTITGIMASSAMPAFAKDYHIDYGDIKVDQDKVSYTDKDGTKYDNEKNEDGDITITGKSDENTVSVKDLAALASAVEIMQMVLTSLLRAARSLPTAALAEPASAVEAAASPAAATALTLPFPAAMSRPTAARLVQVSAAVMAIMPTV